MSNPNKNKGKSFERDIAKHLASVFGLSFFRVPNSGAYTGGMNAHRVDQLSNEQVLLTEGDIVVPKELKEISFECKWYKELSWNKILTSKDGECHLNSWIKQSQDTKKKAWFICFRINRQGEFVCFPLHYCLITEFNIKTPLNYITSKIQADGINGSFIITPLIGFFEENKETILNISKTEEKPL